MIDLKPILLGISALKTMIAETVSPEQLSWRQRQLEITEEEYRKALEHNEAFDCLYLVKQLAGEQDWRKWLNRIAIEQNIQRSLEQASHDITYGRK